MDVFRYRCDISFGIIQEHSFLRPLLLQPYNFICYKFHRTDSGGHIAVDVTTYIFGCAIRLCGCTIYVYQCGMYHGTHGDRYIDQFFLIRPNSDFDIDAGGRVMYYDLHRLLWLFLFRRILLYESADVWGDFGAE